MSLSSVPSIVPGQTVTDGHHADVTDLFDFTNSRPHRPEAAVDERRRYRTVWISDVHLGTRGCNADMLIDFLDHVDSQTMYLVGDIIDGWQLKKRFFWPRRAQ